MFKAQILFGLGVVMLPGFAYHLQKKSKMADDVLVSGSWIEAKSTDSGPFQWLIHTARDKRGVPTSVIYFVANKHKHYVAKLEGSAMKPMDRDSYVAWDVPAKTITACFGWYGGGGDIYYTLKRPHLLRIYHRAIDESDRKPQTPELVKAIKL